MISQVLRLSRLWDAMLPVVSLLVGAAYVGAIDSSLLSLLAGIVVIANSAAIIWNDIEDRVIDKDNGRPEVANQSDNQLRLLKYSVAGMIAVSLGISLLVGWETLYLTLLAVGFTWLYNSPPLQVSRRSISSIIILSGTGAFLPFLLGVSLAGLSLSAILVGLCWWLGRISISILKDYKDARGDAKHGKRTFLLRYGARHVAIVSVLSFIVGYGLFILFAGGGTFGIVLLVAFMCVLVYLRLPLFEKKATYRKLDAIFRRLILYQSLLDIGVAIWLIL